MPRKFTLDNRKVFLKNSFRCGYGKMYAKAGNIIVYRVLDKNGDIMEHRVARVIGRIKESDVVEGHSGVGMLCVLAVTDDLHFGYERWVDPDDVIECMAVGFAKVFMTWLLNAKPDAMMKYIRDDLKTRMEATLPYDAPERSG